jgi:hypothetical protein
MTQDERLNAISDNVTALMLAVDNQTDVLGIINAQLEEVLKWMNRPASSDLHDALNDIAGALKAVDKNLRELPQRVLLAKAGK